MMMTEEDLALVKRLEHYLYDRSPDSYKLWYPRCKCFEDVWREKEKFEKSCPRPDWSQRCRDYGLSELWPYFEESISLKLAIRGY